MYIDQRFMFVGSEVRRVWIFERQVWVGYRVRRFWTGWVVIWGRL